MVMRPMEPVRGWEPWRRGRIRRAFRRFWARYRCRGGHLHSAAKLRGENSRFSVVLEVCKRCDRVLDAEGRKER